MKEMFPKLCWAIGLLALSACSKEEMDSGGARAASDFANDDDGWKIVGDAQAESSKPDYDGMGGNPDGLIRAKDDAIGGVWYFEAPAKYSGDAKSSYGKALDFDLKTTDHDNPFDDHDVVLRGGGVVIAYDTTSDPGVEWTSYSITLSEGSGWRALADIDEEYVDNATFAAKPAATRVQMETVLSALDLFRLRGEFNTGPDTGSLDNVRFGRDP